MRKGVALALGALVAITAVAPLAAQSDDNDYTPLTSRIRRGRQFPLDVVDRWRTETNRVEKARDKTMLGQLTRCLYNRDKTAALALLGKTDLGFANFEQIGLDNDKALRIYGCSDWRNRVAAMISMGVRLRFTAGGLRQWFLQQAYFDRYPNGAAWVKAGNVIGPREFPLSGQQGAIRAVLDFADCVVAADPYTADFFYRTAPDSPDAQRALTQLVPLLGPCVPHGQKVGIQKEGLRSWLGDALWHAATHSGPPPVTPASAAKP